jgi:hypothetical protein
MNFSQTTTYFIYPIDFSVHPKLFDGYLSIDQTTGIVRVKRQIDDDLARESITVVVSAREVLPTFLRSNKAALATLIVKVRAPPRTVDRE